MKKTAFTTVMSILLILVCLFGLVAAGLGVKDGLAIKKYKEEDTKGADIVGQLEDAIALLKKNEDAYNEGVGAYAKGLRDYSAGKKELAAGKKTYNAGKSEYEKGLAAYKQGKKALAEGYAQYEKGKKELEAGKKQVAEGEKALMAAEAQLAAGEKELAEGEAKLKAAERELAAGEKKLAAGEKELKAGAAKLADGKASLEEFENGMALVDEYTMTCYKNKPIYRHNGDMAVPGPEQRLGEDFSWYKVDDNGNVVTLRNGDPYLDLDQCLVVCKTFRESVADHVADVTHELYMRLGLYIALVVASLLGLIAGILGLAGKGGAATLGIITAVLAVACNIFGACTRYYGYTYPLKDGTYSGTLQFIALIAFAVVAVVFTIAACSAKSKAKAEAAAAAAEQ